ncbi:MAG TPA: peptidoglycan-binding domain-containing protein [Vineibacter sp.]|nr:peptidoglycan-binding domain-containing protein [Vineibacter sp.]
MPPSPPDAPQQPDKPQPAVADAPAAPSNAPLQRAEIREVQTKLYTFGFNPGPIDGSDGPMTRAAIMHYEADRGLPQTGEADRSLLESLRQDPAPQVAALPPPPPRRTSHGYAQRRSDDPFAPIRAAGDRLGRWLESLSR